MNVAVLSDVHGNLPALEAVLRATERRKIDELWCLGDIVVRAQTGDAAFAASMS